MMPVALLKSIRQIHNYIGLFFAPTILFFAITGGLQMFGLHESARGSSYEPPAFLTHLAQLHKKGTLYLPPRKSPQASAKPDNSKPDQQKPDLQKAPQAVPASPQPHPLPVKIFFAAAALALVTSTCTGIIMGWKYARKKAPVFAVLTAGILIPCGLLFL